MQRQYSFNFSSIFGLLLLVAFGYLAFKLAKIVYIILLCATPVLFTIVFIMRKQLLIDYFTRRYNKVKAQPMTGLLSAVVSLFFLPFTMFGMLFRAILANKIEKMNPESPIQSKTIDKEFVDFVDLSEDINIDPTSKKTLEDWSTEEWEKKFRN